MGKTIHLTEQQLLNVTGVKFINVPGFNLTLYKYMPLSRVLEMLEKKSIAFLYPELWNDPYEVLFMNTDYTDFDGYRQPDRIYGLCSRNNKYNSEPSWIVYSNDKEPLIRVSFNLKVFLEHIKTFAEKNNCKAYLSKVQYIPAEKIKYVSKNGSDEYNRLFSKSVTDDTYIELMSIKRKAFEYEDEFRFFILPKTKDGIDINCFKDKEMKILMMPIQYDAFAKFVMEPLPRIKGDDIEKKITTQLYEATFKKVKEMIKAYDPNFDVDYSSLYSNKSPFKKINR